MTDTAFLFRNREDAADRLVRRLQRFRGVRTVVLALPRGGVPIGYVIAKALRAPLDLVLVRKIGAPDQPELAIGAVVDGTRVETVINREIVESLHVFDEYLEQRVARELEEIERRRASYLAGRSRIDVAGRTAIVVDDGIATGATVRAALLAIRRSEPERLVLAVPVAPRETLEALTKEVDELVCLSSPEYFHAIGQFYLDFKQVPDAEVKVLLNAVSEDRAEATWTDVPAEPTV